MKVEIDKNGCIGNGNCESICSDVFKVEGGKGKVLKSEVDAGLKDDLLQAAQDCPVQVISVFDGPKRLYPPKK
ncbi:MAG: ferredoxin [Nitrospirae bacterium]|nr:ferredoxin [Nitrospirota bacterium]MBI3605710.1 ferredoxin [Nitrospirota bacterium]